MKRVFAVFSSFIMMIAVFLFMACSNLTMPDDSGTTDSNQGDENPIGDEAEILPDLLGSAEWTSYFVSYNREGTDQVSSWLPWPEIPSLYITVENGILHRYDSYSYNTMSGPSSVTYRETRYTYKVEYEETLIQSVPGDDDSWVTKKIPKYSYVDGEGNTGILEVEQEGRSLVLYLRDDNYSYYSSYYFWLKNTGNTTATGDELKELSVKPLLDGLEVDEDSVIENTDPKTLSFMLLKPEGVSDALPDVDVQWKILSGSDYASLGAADGNEIQITNENYSGSVQTVSICLSVIPDDIDYKISESIVEIKTASLPKKDIGTQILYDGKTPQQSEFLGSVSDAILSYSLAPEDGNEIEATSKWEITDGSDYVIGENNGENFKISNVNCSGESKSITVTLTVTPKHKAYEVSSVSITFIVEDSTSDIQPGQFSADVAFAYRKNTLVHDGRIKISWTRSANAKDYFVYRNGNRIACVKNSLEYLDGGFPADISEGNPTLTYYVEAVNLELSSRTSNVSIDASSVIPTAPTGCSILPMKDSDGYYGVKIDWEYNDYPPYGFYVYRLLSSSSYSTADNVIKNGKIVLGAGPDDNVSYNSNTNTLKFSLWDYDIVNEITSSKKYAHYVVVGYNCWYPEGFPAVSAVEVQSSPSNVNSQYCAILVGKDCRWSSSDQYPTTSGTISGSLSLSASKCIVYNRYSYCELNFPVISGATYRIYRCERMSTNFGTVRPSNCAYIGSTTSVTGTYIDGGVCNQYMWENTASVGRYFWYMYYYVEAVDSKGKVYASSVVRAQ